MFFNFEKKKKRRMMMVYLRKFMNIISLLVLVLLIREEQFHGSTLSTFSVFVASFHHPSTVHTTNRPTRTVAQNPLLTKTRDCSAEKNILHRYHPVAKTSSSSLYVFERMSEDCISAIVTAQKQTNKYQLEYVDRQAMLTGIVDHPETKALQRTLQQYRISWRLIEKTFHEIYNLDDVKSTASTNAAGWLSGFRAAKQTDGDTDRPFSKELKLTLTEAGKIANRMGSTTISTHHIFLALLDYKESGKDGIPSATDSVYDVSTSSPWYLLKKMNAMDDQTTPLNVCQTLLTNLAQNSDSLDGQSNSQGELVAGMGGSSSSKMPTLNEFGTDLTQLAADGLLDPVYGRENEIRSCIRTLLRRRKNNVCLLGEPGVGKTAIAEGVARMLVDEMNCPTPLKGHRLVSLELSSLVAGTKYRGEFEERLQGIIKEVTNPKAPPTILFIDEIHNLVGAGSASEGGTMDAANILKPALARGEMQIIGATTIAEYRKYIEKDAALERRLQPITIREPSVEQTIQILQAVQSNYERHHNVKYTPLALQAAAALSERYITDRFLPDKALDLLDESGAIAQLEYLEQRNSDGDYTNEASLNIDEDEYVPIVTEHTVAEIMSEWSGIPIGKLEANEMDRLRYLENELSVRVKGQYRATKGVARAIRRARSGLRDPKRPVASFLFCGPTGTGKTELCKTLAETYYGSEKDMIRIDMSEYMEKHTTSRLTGPPPGYIGYEAGGQLTEAVRRRPHSVVLLDEIEKAHEDVLNILLQVMEDGILTDGKGRTVNFKNTVIVMTSNVGSRRILEVARKHGANKVPRKSSAQDDDVEELVASAIRAVKARETPKSSESEKNDIEAKSLSKVVASEKPNVQSPTVLLPELVPSVSNIQPMKPEEVLRKMKDNPKAASILMKAATDPEIMNAVRIAMNGSPADLMKEAQRNPTISKFLLDVWNELEGDDSKNNGIEETSKNQSPPPLTTKTAAAAPKSGLDSIRNSFAETMNQWDDSASNAFATGLMKQLGPSDTPVPSDNRNNIIIEEGKNIRQSVDDIQIEAEIYPELISVVQEELELAMKPEFLNRIDEIVVFSPLSSENLAKIAGLTIEKIVKRAVTEQSIEELIVEPNLVQRVMDEGSANAEQFGARPMRRAAQRYIEDTLSDAIICGFFTLDDGQKETRATLSLAPPHLDGKDRVSITRASDGKVLEISVEDASGGIGGIIPPKQTQSTFGGQSTIANGSRDTSEEVSVNGRMLQTEPSP